MYVDNLSYDATDSDICELFEAHDTVSDVFIEERPQGGGGYNRGGDRLGRGGYGGGDRGGDRGGRDKY